MHRLRRTPPQRADKEFADGAAAPHMVSSSEMLSPDEREHPSRPGDLCFVFIDASVCYVDQRGEHSGLLSESLNTEEERCRLRTVSNNEQWLRAAVVLGDELIDLARRSGDADAWGCTSGHFGGSDPGPNRVMHVLRAVTGRRPPKPAFGPLARPKYGRWSVRQVFAYDPGKDTPNVAIWHLGFTQNPQFFPRWCAAIGAGSRSPVLILPDSPIMRDLARRWNAGQLIPRRQSWRGDNIRDYVGSAAYVRTRISAAVEVDGSEIPGDRLVGAIAFLRAQHQLRVSPFNLLRDPLLAAQLSPVEVGDQAWSAREIARLAMLRKRYDKPQRVHAWLAVAGQTLPTGGVFGTGDRHASFSHSCLRTAERALRLGEVATAFVPQPPPAPWRPDWARAALERGERPEVPASSGPSGQLVDWYRQTFSLAVRYGLIDAEWFSKREAWHAHAYRTFPGRLTDYYDHICAAERALGSGSERGTLALVGDLSKWYREVFRSAAQLGLAEPDDTANEVS